MRSDDLERLHEVSPAIADAMMCSECRVSLVWSASHMCRFSCTGSGVVFVFTIMSLEQRVEDSSCKILHGHGLRGTTSGKIEAAKFLGSMQVGEFVHRLRTTHLLRRDDTEVRNVVRRLLSEFRATVGEE